MKPILLLLLFISTESVLCRIFQPQPVENVGLASDRLEKLRTDFNCPAESGYYPAVDGSCRSDYFYCYEGEAFYMECPGDTVFDYSGPYCTEPSQCNPSEIRTISMTTVFPCPAPDGFFPVDDQQCSADYYVCVSGVAYPQECPCVSSCTVFDPAVNTCVSLEESSCGPSGGTSTIPTTVIMLSTSTTSGTFSCPEMNGNFPFPGECNNNYYLCVEGSPFVVSCPAGLVYNPATYSCDSPENVIGCTNKARQSSPSAIQ